MNYKDAVKKLEKRYKNGMIFDVEKDFFGNAISFKDKSGISLSHKRLKFFGGGIGLDQFTVKSKGGEKVFSDHDGYNAKENALICFAQQL